MADIITFTPEEEMAYHDWIATRPLKIQEMIRDHPPTRLYRLKTSDHRVTIHSYSENGTVTVTVSGDYNAVMFERNVFGVDPNDLEECDLPEPSEPHGVILTNEQAEAYIDAIRPHVLKAREAN